MQLVFYSKTSWKTILRVLPPTFKPVLQKIKLSQVAQNCCRKSKVVLRFATKSVHVARFTDPRRTCFTASEVIPIYGANPAQFHPISSQSSGNLPQPDLLKDRFERDRYNVNIAIQIVLQQCFETSRTFCCPFYRSLRWDQSMHKWMVSYQSITVTYGHTGVKCLSFSD